jgi:predicted amidophosphoribosyltransferase
MQCPSCRAEVPEGSRFCSSCGAALRVHCHQCGHTYAPGSKFCSECGARLTRIAATARPLPPSDTAERRQMTVLFCDIAESTALSASLDPEDLRSVIATYRIGRSARAAFR